MNSDIILNDALSARKTEPRRSAISRFWQPAESYEQQNIEAARIFLGGLGRYGGETGAW